MPYNIIFYIRLPYFHVSNSALFSTKYFSTLILYRRSLGTFYYINNCANIELSELFPKENNFYSYPHAAACRQNYSDICNMRHGLKTRWLVHTIGTEGWDHQRSIHVMQTWDRTWPNNARRLDENFKQIPWTYHAVKSWFSVFLHFPQNLSFAQCYWSLACHVIFK